MTAPWRLERYGGVSVLCVMAAPAEYGARLRARIQPLFVGVGPVEAAVALTAALARLEAADGLPDLYDYDNNSAGVGRYCLMCAQFSKNPQEPCAYLKVLNGWISPTALATPAAPNTKTKRCRRFIFDPPISHL